MAKPYIHQHSPFKTFMPFWNVTEIFTSNKLQKIVFSARKEWKWVRKWKFLRSREQGNNVRHFLAVQTSLSFVISLLSSILVFSAMQFCRQFFLSSQLLTIFSGVVGSWLFILLLTVWINESSLLKFLLNKTFILGHFQHGSSLAGQRLVCSPLVPRSELLLACSLPCLLFDPSSSSYDMLLVFIHRLVLRQQSLAEIPHDECRRQRCWRVQEEEEVKSNNLK